MSKKIKLDLKDRKILYQLDLNSRQTLNQIGKKVGLPKNVVAYRIKRLEEKGIIENYYTVIDASKLGYISIRFYLTFQYTTPEIEKEIVDYFTKNKHSWWVASCEQRFDLAVVMWVKEINEFYGFWKKTLEKFGDYFESNNVNIYMNWIHFNYSYLIDKKTHDEGEIAIGGSSKTDFDKKDFEILKIIGANARMPVTEIASKLNTTAMVVKYRIKKMQKNGIVLGFRTNFNIEKLGMLNFKVDFTLKEYKDVKKIETYIKQNPNLTYIDRAVGLADLEIEFHFKSMKDFHDMISKLKAKFPDSIRNYKYLLFTKVHKVQLMPME